MPGEAIHYREYAPGAALAPWVRAFFTFGVQAARARDLRTLHAATFPSAQAICPALFADAGASLVVRLGGEWRVTGLEATAACEPRAVVLGPMTRGRATRFGDRIDAVGAYFLPGALGLFTRVPVRELRDRSTPAGEVFAGSTARAVERLGATPDATLRLARLHALLAAELRDAEGSDAVRARRACEVIEASGGAFSVEGAADTEGISRQYFTRRFHAAVGVTPRAFSRMTRFRRVLRALGRRCGPSWALVAPHFGYADQSHWIAEFREFTGLTPAAFAASQQFHPFAQP